MRRKIIVNLKDLILALRVILSLFLFFSLHEEFPRMRLYILAECIEVDGGFLEVGKHTVNFFFIIRNNRFYIAQDKVELAFRRPRDEVAHRARAVEDEGDRRLLRARCEKAAK